jgi:hypothetical protein
MFLTRKRLKGLGFISFILFFLWLFISYFGAMLATSPMRKKVPQIQEIEGFAVKNVVFETNDKLKISAWYVNNQENQLNKDTAVILLGGIWADRRGCIQNAIFYLKRGYSFYCLICEAQVIVKVIKFLMVGTNEMI